MSKRIFTLLLFCLVSSAVIKAQVGITKEDVRNYLTKKDSSCFDIGYKWAVQIKKIEFYDVNSDGKDEVIVIASSCYSGTGGPDIHGVYAKDSTGKILELTVNDNIKTFEGKPVYDNLVGNRNYILLYENNLLIEKFHDGSGRKNPLTLYFKWNGKEFNLAKVEKAEIFKTSFSCANAKTDIEKTICGNSELAAMDLKLDSLYTEIMSKLPKNKREELRDEHKEWINKRDNNCNYKGVADCLLEMFTKRIKYLTKLNKGKN
jgi:uncharacterized protein YecT (DUF1311 family)